MLPWNGGVLLTKLHLAIYSIPFVYSDSGWDYGALNNNNKTKNLNNAITASTKSNHIGSPLCLKALWLQAGVLSWFSSKPRTQRY
jgi:hypothetical protein